MLSDEKRWRLIIASFIVGGVHVTVSAYVGGQITDWALSDIEKIPLQTYINHAFDFIWVVYLYGMVYICTRFTEDKRVRASWRGWLMHDGIFFGIPFLAWLLRDYLLLVFPTILQVVSGYAFYTHAPKHRWWS